MKACFLGQRELFNGLAIQDLEESRDNPWPEYPVLYLDLNPARYDSEEALLEILNSHLKNREEKFNIKKASELPARRFFNVIQKAYEQNRQVSCNSNRRI